MPAERRQILLSAEETLHAIQSYARMRPQFLPHGQVLGFRLDGGEEEGGIGLTISVEAVYGATRTVLDVRTTQPDIVELLIRCCLENNIPIPRSSAKAAAVVDGHLALIVRHDSQLLTDA